MTKFIASAGRGRLGRHPLPLALAAALMLAEPCTGRAEGDSPLLLAHADHAGAHFSALLGLRGSGALRERHQRIPDRPASTIVVTNCNDAGRIAEERPAHQRARVIARLRGTHQNLIVLRRFE